MTIYLKDVLIKNGVNVYINDSVKELVGDEYANKAVFKSGTVLDIDMIIVATGIRPNVELTKKAGVDLVFQNTFICSYLGMEAIRKGYSVRFYRACDLATQLSEAQSEKKLNGMLKALHKCQLLCVDELGYMTLDPKSSQLLFQVLAGRYEVRSTMITSNLEFSKWPNFIGDPIMATALVDRLVHRSAILNMNGEGYRLNHQ